MTQIHEKRYGARFSGSVITQQPTYFVHKQKSSFYFTYLIITVIIHEVCVVSEMIMYKSQESALLGYLQFSIQDLVLHAVRKFCTGNIR